MAQYSMHVVVMFYHCSSVDIKYTEKVGRTENAVDFRISVNKPGGKKCNSCGCARLQSYERGNVRQLC